MSETILAELQAYEAELIEIRRDIHAHPEIGFEETRTAALVAEKLRGWGVEVAEGLAKTGVVGTVRGTRPGQRAIGLRADMDALNILEKTNLPYASQNPGKMHACGHDGHTTMLLGAARYLAEHPDFGGTVHFIFQPAEEGGGGGRVMVEEGLFDRFPCDAVYGMHNKPGIPVGKFGTRPGPMLAAADSWHVIFRGTGGHGGAAPHLATDPTIPQAHFVLALQSIIGRNVPALHTAVLSIGYISGGAWGSPNVIPSEVTIRGTARCYLPETRAVFERRLAELGHSLAAAHGCTAEVVYEKGYPPMVNDPEQIKVAIAAAEALAGTENVDGNMAPITAGEDFAFMLQKKPGGMIMIGNGVNEDGSFHNVHTPHYDFNDEILTLGVAYWLSVVQQELAATA
jgi:amidohydrolase